MMTGQSLSSQSTIFCPTELADANGCALKEHRRIFSRTLSRDVAVDPLPSEPNVILFVS